MGASDQWGNIPMGVELIRKVRGDEAYALTFAARHETRRDEVRQDRGGGLYLDAGQDSPYALYQYFIQVEGSSSGAYLRYFTFLSTTRSAPSTRRTAQRPRAREAQRSLARRRVQPGARGRRRRLAPSVPPGRCSRRRWAALDEATLLEGVRRHAVLGDGAGAALDGAGLTWSRRWRRSGLVTLKSSARNRRWARAAPTSTTAVSAPTRASTPPT